MLLNSKIYVILSKGYIYITKLDFVDDSCLYHYDC